MKPFLILQARPLDVVADNEYEAFLSYGQLTTSQTHRIRMEKESLSGIDLNNYAGVMVGGSPCNVSDPESIKPAYQKRFEAELHTLFQQIIALDKPYLGSCYGLGVLIKSLGGIVSKAQYGEPAGPATIQLTASARQDPLLKGLPPSFPAFVGHKEACQAVPEVCTLLARSADCPVQMLRFQQNIYATQFHVELDKAGMGVRIKYYKDHGYFEPAAASELMVSIRRVETQEPHEILRRFVLRYGV